MAESKKPEGTSACHINRKMFPVKVTYFCELGAVSSLLPYLAVYMLNIGLTYSELSIIYGISPFLSAILRTPAGMLADKCQKHKLMLVICCILSGLFHGLLLLVPKVEHSESSSSQVCNAPVSVHCSGAENYLEYCSEEKDLICLNGGNCSEVARAPFYNATSCHIQCNSTQPVCLEPDNSLLTLGYCGGEGTNSSMHKISFDVEQITLSQSSIIDLNPTTHCPQHLMSYISHEDVEYARLDCPGTYNMDLSSCSMSCEASEPPGNASACSTFEGTPAKPYQQTFWVFFSLFIIGQLFFTPSLSLLDAIVYDYLGPDAAEFGNQRLWGSVGFAVCAVISGFSMDTFTSTLNLSEGGWNFIYAFVSFAFLSIFGGVMAAFFKISPDISSASMLKDLGTLFRSLEVMLLFVCSLMYGFYTGIIETFLYVHLQEIGAPKLLMGLCMFFNCIPEILIFRFAGPIIGLLKYWGCLCVVFFAYGARLIVYAFLTNPWYVLLVEPLHSITFGLMYASVTVYATKLTPEGMHGTIQSIIGTLYFGFGKGTGSIVSGQMYAALGAMKTFVIFGVSAIVCLIIYAVIHHVAVKKNTEADEPADEKETEMPMIKSANDDKLSPEEERLDEVHLTDESHDNAREPQIA